jgi:hypothetical protein
MASPFCGGSSAPISQQFLLQTSRPRLGMATGKDLAQLCPVRCCRTILAVHSTRTVDRMVHVLSERNSEQFRTRAAKSSFVDSPRLFHA